MPIKRNLIDIQKLKRNLLILHEKLVLIINFLCSIKLENSYLGNSEILAYRRRCSFSDSCFSSSQDSSDIRRYLPKRGTGSCIYYHPRNLGEEESDLLLQKKENNAFMILA